MARRALAHRGDPGSLCRLESGRASWWEHRVAPKAPARGRRLLIGGRNLVDAFRRHAGDALTVPSRLSRLSHAAVIPCLCSRGWSRGVHSQRWPADPGPSGCRRDRHGRRHRVDALHRNERAACERTLAARGPIRRRERGDRGRRVGAGALACRRPWRPASPAPLSKCARRCYLGHALHRDGGPDPALGRAAADQRARAVERSARHRGRNRRLRRLRNLPADFGAGSVRRSG